MLAGDDGRGTNAGMRRDTLVHDAECNIIKILLLKQNAKRG